MARIRSRKTTVSDTQATSPIKDKVVNSWAATGLVGLLVQWYESSSTVKKISITPELRSHHYCDWCCHVHQLIRIYFSDKKYRTFFSFSFLRNNRTLFEYWTKVGFPWPMGQPTYCTNVSGPLNRAYYYDSMWAFRDW